MREKLCGVMWMPQTQINILAPKILQWETLQGVAANQISQNQVENTESSV